MHIGKSQSNEQEAVVRPSISQYSDTSVGAGVGPSQTVGRCCWLLAAARLARRAYSYTRPPSPASRMWMCSRDTEKARGYEIFQ